MTNYRALCAHLISQAPAENTRSMLLALLDALPASEVRKATCPCSKTRAGRDGAFALGSFLRRARPVPEHCGLPEFYLTPADLRGCEPEPRNRCRCC